MDLDGDLLRLMLETLIAMLTQPRCLPPRLGVEGDNGCEGTTETPESVAGPGEATRGKHMREVMLVVWPGNYCQ